MEIFSLHWCNKEHKGHFATSEQKVGSRVPLSNVTAILESDEKYIELKWFNAYPNIEKSLKAKENRLINFYGPIRKVNGKIQIVNPKLEQSDSDTLVKYPTINTVPGNRLAELIKKFLHLRSRKSNLSFKSTL